VVPSAKSSWELQRWRGQIERGEVPEDGSSGLSSLFATAETPTLSTQLPPSSPPNRARLLPTGATVSGLARCLHGVVAMVLPRRDSARLQAGAATRASWQVQGAPARGSYTVNQNRARGSYTINQI
jgi:hypothetical protein